MRIIILLALALFLLVFLVIWISYLWSIVAIFDGGAPFVPITKKVLNDVFKLAEINNGSVFYDLGCGDGRVLAFGARLNPDTKFIGIEKNFVPFLMSRFKNRNNMNVKIECGDMFKRDLSDATHIYVYLFPEIMQKLLLKFKKELKPGTVVVASDFNFDDIEPYKTVKTGFTDGLGGTLYLYKF